MEVLYTIKGQIMENIKYTVFFTNDYAYYCEHMTNERLIKYAENRLEANENDRDSFSFNTYDMNTKQAIKVIESYGERVNNVRRVRNTDDRE